jgi:hypothetical protein
MTVHAHHRDAHRAQAIGVSPEHDQAGVRTRRCGETDTFSRVIAIGWRRELILPIFPG